jgi:hypothetical protein
MNASERLQKMNAALAQARLLDQVRDITPELIQTYPGFAWVKRYDPVTRAYYMILLSEMYVTKLLGPKVIEYVGKSDFDFWPDDVAALFWANDEQARTGEPAFVKEPFKSPLTGVSGVFDGVKWSFRIGTVEYVAGIGRVI